MNVGKSGTFQGFRGDGNRGSVDRRKDNLQFFFPYICKGSIRHTGIDEGIVDFLTDDMQQLVVSVEMDFAGLYLSYFLNDLPVLRRHDLTTVIPVNFVTVVFGRIMGSSQDNSGIASQVPHGEREF